MIVDYGAQMLQWKGKALKMYPYRLLPSLDTAGIATDEDTAIPKEYIEVIQEYSDVFYIDGKPFGQCPCSKIYIYMQNLAM